MPTRKEMLFNSATMAGLDRKEANYVADMADHTMEEMFKQMLRIVVTIDDPRLCSMVAGTVLLAMQTECGMKLKEIVKEVKTMKSEKSSG